MTLPGLPDPWLLVGGLAGAIALAGGSYALGHHQATVAEQARALKAIERVQQAADATRARIDAVAGSLGAARTEQGTETRIIYNEAQKIVVRDVYRNVCADADGVGLLDRAADNAERGLAGKPAG